MQAEKHSCCFCSNIILDANIIIDGDILDLLKFLIANVDASALENSTVCEDCLIKIIEICDYKKNSTKMLETKNEIDPEKPIRCQKCDKVCAQGDNFPLVDCITQTDFLDFVNYLFDQDVQLVGSLQVCNSCRISIIHLQKFLKLIYVYDQSKIKCNVDNCDDIKATGNMNLMEDNVEINQEYENFILDDNMEIENIIEDNKTEIGDGYVVVDDNQYTDRCGKADVGREMTSSGGSDRNNFNNKEEKSEIDFQENIKFRYKILLHEHKSADVITSKVHECDKCNYSTLMKSDMLNHSKIHNDIQDCTCSYLKNFLDKTNLNNHSFKVHKSEDVTCNACQKYNNETEFKAHLLRNKLKHGINVRSEKYKCQCCTYETYSKIHLDRHVEKHVNSQDFKCTLCSKCFAQKQLLDNHLLQVHKNKDNKRNIKKQINIRDFKCTLCSKSFTKKVNLDDHLLIVHKSSDNVTYKIFECDNCSYETTKRNNLLKHKLKHGITEELQKYKCEKCIYETYDRSNLIRHMKIHNRIRKVKRFTLKESLDDHLLKIYKSRGNIISKIYKCNVCSYETANKSKLSQHKLEHGKTGNSLKTVEFKKHKCQNCTYETYDKSSLIKHRLHHKIIYKCTLCSKTFTKRDLKNHLLKVHKNKDSQTTVDFKRIALSI